MKEPTDNIGLVCSSCAPTPGKFSNSAPQEFINKYCKLGFISVTKRIEHMWVLVKEEKDGKLIGTLNNDPVLLHVPFLFDGSVVTFETKDIEAVS